MKEELYHKGEVPELIINPYEKPSLVIKRDKYYELHFKNRIEFITLTGKCLGWSEVKKVE